MCALFHNYRDTQALSESTLIKCILKCVARIVENVCSMVQKKINHLRHIYTLKNEVAVVHQMYMPPMASSIPIRVWDALQFLSVRYIITLHVIIYNALLLLLLT